jgi:hypothetical protein
MISALIKENRDLHRQIDKLSKLTVGAGSGIAERTLRSLQRRISGTVGGGEEEQWPSLGGDSTRERETRKDHRSGTTRVAAPSVGQG